MFEKDANLSELLDVLKITRVALESKSVDELQKEVLLCCEKTFQCSSSNFVLFRKPHPQLTFERVVSRGISQEYCSLYKKRYYAYDPMWRGVGFLGDRSVVSLEEIVSFNTFLRSHYYNNFLKPQSIYHQLALCLQRGRRLLGVVVMFRPKERPPFSASDKNKASMMIPYLVGALEKAFASDHAYVYQSIIDTVDSDLIYGGMMVLDRALKPLYYNETALAIIRGLQEFNCSKSKIPPLPDEIYERCKALISSAPDLECDQSFHDEVKLPVRKLGQEVSIRLRLTQAGDKAPLLLVYFDPPENSSNHIEHLTRHGLSRREYEVAFLVAKGLKSAQVAEKLFISEYTVDNHLRSIYRKLGVNNRTSLAYCLLQSH
jgi:DNA-binding CsgD family transcriptional regulator